MKPPVLAPPTAHASATVVAREPLQRGSTRPRVPYRVPCRVRLVDPLTSEVRSVVGETLSISHGGMSLQLAVGVPVGTWAETLVLKPNGEPLLLAGTVTHCRRTLAATFELTVRATRPETFV